MKTLASIILILLIFQNISAAILINEVELNPVGGKDGKEWIELYNDNSVGEDISGWAVYDGLSSPIKRYVIPGGTEISGKDYYIIEFEGSVLNNAGEFVTLYNSDGSKIDETETLKEVDWSEKTWQFCDGKWLFAEATKGSKNNCDSKKESKKTDDKTASVVSENKTEIPTKTSEDIKKVEYTQQSMIRLNAQDIKTEEGNGNLSKEKYALYGLIIFCALLMFLFIIKMRKNKNEFEE